MRFLLVSLGVAKNQIPAEPRSISFAFVAVGMKITPHPPRGSVRAHFSAYGSYLECLASKRTSG